MIIIEYLKTILKLSRLKEYLPLLFLIFVLIAIISPENLLSYEAVIIFLANLLLTAFAYAINDVEDAEDDYHDLKKRKRNIISNGTMEKGYGYVISFFLLAIGLTLLFLLDTLVFLVGMSLSLNSFLYSWKKLRLKSFPFLDLVSHALCLGVPQFLTTYLTFNPLNLQIIPFLIMIIPFSFSAQLSQEIRDFEVDKKVKINNTFQIIGKKNSIMLIHIFCFVISIGFVLLTNSFQLVNYSICLFPLGLFTSLAYFKVKHGIPFFLLKKYFNSKKIR